MNNTRIDKMKRIVRILTRDNLQCIVILYGNVSQMRTNFFGKLIVCNFY